MPLRIVRTRALPIGVDLGSSAVKLVQLRRGPETMEIVAAAARPVPASSRRPVRARLDFLGKTIRQIVKDGAFAGRRCVLSIPAADTFVQHVKLPAGADEAIPAALAEELRPKLPYPPEQAVIRHVVAAQIHGDGPARREVIAVCAPRERLEGYLAMARRCKLDVIAVNIEPCAIVECFGRLFRRAGDAQRAALFVDLGSGSTQVVLAHGSRIVFARNLPAGGDQLNEAVARGLQISPEDAARRRQALQGEDAEAADVDRVYGLLDAPVAALAEELTQCLRYYESVFPNQPVERAIFVGGEAHDRRLCQAIAQRLNLAAQVGDPLAGVRSGNPKHVELDRRTPQPDWAVAVGLGLGAQPAA